MLAKIGSSEKEVKSLLKKSGFGIETIAWFEGDRHFIRAEK